jgi:anti-sigma factor RsiW
MNCKKIEELLVLYSELTPTEKTTVEAHLENCSACTALFENLQKQQEVMAKAKKWSPEIKDPIAFTDRIMEALPRQSGKPTKQKNMIFNIFNWTSLQTALAACSLVLVFTFAVEFNYTEKTIQAQPTLKNGVALSTNPEKLIRAKHSRIERFSLEEIIKQYNTLALSNQ